MRLTTVWFPTFPKASPWVLVTCRVSPAAKPWSHQAVFTPEPSTVVLADDNPRIPGLVARILGSEFRIIAHVTDGEALVEAACRLCPDVLIVDVAMPRLNGIQAVEQLCLCRAQTAAIVFLTSHGDEALVERAFAAGGHGFVLKQAATEDLAVAIVAARGGQTFVSPSLKLRHNPGISPVSV